MSTQPFPTYNPNIAPPPLITTDSWYSVVLASRVTGLQPPLAEDDAVTKLYADTIANTSTTWKESVKVATTSNILLFGDQLIDGVFVTQGNRVLVKNQIDPEDNGIYSVISSGMWIRTGDVPVGYNSVNMVMLVDQGTVNASKTYRMNAIPGIIGTDDITFIEYATGSSGADFTWKNVVVAATTVAGTLATDFETGDTIDGVLLATGDRILIKDQALSSQNGIYTVNTTGAPTRTTDAALGISASGTSVIASKGTTNANTVFICITPDADFGDSITYGEISGSEQFVNQKTWKDSVIAASTVAGNLATDFEDGDIIDGVTLTTGDRILIKDQAIATENGIYTVNASGTPTRAVDAEIGFPASGSGTIVTQGSYAGKLYIVTSPSANFGDSITFSEFAGGGGGGPAGSSTWIQYNSSGSFAATSNLTWDTGVLGVTGTVDATEVVATSDKRLKHNIMPLSIGLDKLKEIDTYSYNFIKSKDPLQKHRIGVMAQQLEEIGLGHLVNTKDDNYKSVNYLDMMPIIIKSLQELNDKVDKNSKLTN